jgi:hypothetical protein
MFGKPSIYDYNFTKKQNHDYHQWGDIREKSEKEKIKKNLSGLISMKIPNTYDILNKEQHYFEKWFRE